jgi:N-acetylmuramoyl-L-alanine amidase
LGQKVHPVGFRLGVIRTWNSKWFDEKNYAQWLYEDLKIRECVKKSLNHAGVSKVEIERAANKAKADLFVSVHVNAAANAQSAGFETFYLDIASNAEAARLATMENAGSDKKMGDLTTVLADFMLSARTQESRQLARTLQNATLSRLGKLRYATRDGGVKAAPLHVLIGASVPAVLVELGFCSNREEARRLANTAYRQALAEGIAEGILAYRDTLLRKQTVDVTLNKQRS